MAWKWMTVVWVALLIVGCGKDATQKNGDPWETCETSSDCDDGYSCSGEQCVSNNASNNDDGDMGGDFVDFNNGYGETNNAVANNANNGSNNASSNNGTQNNMGEYCPLTGAPVPADLAAVHTVRLQVESEYPQRVWIATQGYYCTPFAVRNEQGDTLPLGLGARCGCECPYPGSPGPAQLRAVQPGETVTVEWDGRHLVTYQDCVECWDDWQMPPVYETAATAQPAPAGTYSASMPFMLELPAGCSDSGDGTASCDPNPDPDAGEPFVAVASVCPSNFAITGSSDAFDLPGPNDPAETIDVSVVLPAGP